MTTRWSRWCLVLGMVGALLGMLSGCGGDEEALAKNGVDLREVLRAPVQASNPVAEVHKRPISADVLKSLLERPGDPRTKDQILADLIRGEERFEEAVEAGYADSAEMVRLHKQLMVQQYLREMVHKPTEPAALSTEEVRKYYETHYTLYKTPQLRMSDHILAIPSEKKWDIRKDADKIPPEVFKRCEEISRAIHAEILKSGTVIKNGDDLQVWADRWKDKLPEEVELSVEKLPPAPKEQFGTPDMPGFLPAFAEEYANALFGLKEGELSGPVNSPFGTHLIVLKQIVPQEEIPFDKAESGIRDFLSVKKRESTYKKLMVDLKKKNQLKVDTEFRDKMKKREEQAKEKPSG